MAGSRTDRKKLADLLTALEKILQEGVAQGGAPTLNELAQRARLKDSLERMSAVELSRTRAFRQRFIIAFRDAVESPVGLRSGDGQGLLALARSGAVLLLALRQARQRPEQHALLSVAALRDRVAPELRQAFAAHLSGPLADAALPPGCGWVDTGPGGRRFFLLQDLHLAAAPQATPPAIPDFARPSTRRSPSSIGSEAAIIW